MTIKGYMQSHLTDYYLGNGMATPPNPNITYTGTAARMEDEGTSLPVTTINNPFDIFPNPNNGAFINVNVPVKEKDDLVFTITNERGQLLFEKKLGPVEAGAYSTRINISRARLAPGNYIASIRSKSGIQSKLFVKL
jgi:rhamnogalacturonan endolyase